MKVHSSTQNYFSAPIRSQQSGDSDDSSPFTLPGDSDDQQDDTQGPSMSSSGIPSSISSGLWLSQFGDSSSDSADDQWDSDASCSGSTSSSQQSDQDILDEFAKLANMTPAQKIRAQYLESHGLTEDSFKALSADNQKAINDQIANEIKQKLGVDNVDGDGEQETDDTSSALSIA